MLAFMQHLNYFFLELSELMIIPGLSFNTFFFYTFLFVIMISVFLGRR